MVKVILYTDGGARGNPGIAGAGVVITDTLGAVLKRGAKPLGFMTNNEAEYQAVLFGLETLKRMYGKEEARRLNIEVRLDSELVASQLNGKYQIKEDKLVPLFMKVWNERVKDFPQIIFTHVPREKNLGADQMANEAMDEQEKTKPKLF